jgi:MerR family transcriptional regulator, copper efflux regulator
MKNADTFHIGDVAARTGLSLRTLRYWEEMGLVEPTGRTDGGFRLYAEVDIQRLLLVRALKPADFTLEELQEILRLRDLLARDDLDGATRAKSERELERFLERAADRCKILRERLVAAELAMSALRESLTPTAD